MSGNIITEKDRTRLRKTDTTKALVSLSDNEVNPGKEGKKTDE